MKKFTLSMVLALAAFAISAASLAPTENNHEFANALLMKETSALADDTYYPNWCLEEPDSIRDEGSVLHALSECVSDYYLNNIFNSFRSVGGFGTGSLNSELGMDNIWLKMCESTPLQQACSATGGEVVTMDADYRKRRKQAGEPENFWSSTDFTDVTIYCLGSETWDLTTLKLQINTGAPVCARTNCTVSIFGSTGIKDKLVRDSEKKLGELYNSTSISCSLVDPRSDNAGQGSTPSSDENGSRSSSSVSPRSDRAGQGPAPSSDGENGRSPFSSAAWLDSITYMHFAALMGSALAFVSAI